LRPHMSSLKNLFAMMKSEPAQNLIIILILLCYPSLVLTVRGGMGVLFFLLFLASLASLYRTRNTLSTPHWDKYSIAFALAMASPVLAIFLSQAYHGQFKAAPYDWASRFLLSIPIFLALRQTNIRTITILQIGIPLGALITLIVLRLHSVDWGGRHTTSYAFNLIHFGDTALMLGLLSLFSINWGRKDHALILIFKLCAFLAGVYMSIQSGERGGWIAIPPLLLLWAISHNKERSWLKLILATLAVCSAAWISYVLSNSIQFRIDSIFHDLNAFSNGNKDTSLGIRLQQWQAAIHLFLENPLFGVSPGGIPQAMPALIQQGLLTPEAARMMSAAEVHSEIFAKGAETGIFGLLSLLSIYIIPTVIFWRTAQTSTPQARRASFMGICLVAGFFIFGLTAEIFNLKMTAAFFALTLAVLMAAATNKTSQQESSSHV